MLHSNDKKKKKKKNKTPTPATDADDGNQHGTNKTQHQLHAAAELALPQRLEIAAAHSDLHAALVGLVGWSRLSINTEAILTFFQCDALLLLLKNVLSSRLNKTDTIYEHLAKLLENCLHVELNGKSRTSNVDVAAAIVRTVRATAMQLSTQFMKESQPARPTDSGDLDHHGDEDQQQQAEAITEVAKALSKVVVQYRLSLNGVQLESALSQEVLALEAKLAAAAAQDSAVKGQAIRDSFQRRDIRSDALSLYEARLAAMTKLVHEHEARNNTTTMQVVTETTEQVDGMGEGDEEEHRVKAEMSKLIADKAKRLTPIKTKIREKADLMVALDQEQADLEARLREVNQKILATGAEQHALKSQVDAIEDEFLKTHAPLIEQHEQIMRRHHRRQCLVEINGELRKLEDAIQNISDKHSETLSLQDKQVTCLRQQMEGFLRYFSSELPCVQFMTNRANEADANMLKLLEEAKGYEAMGVDAVAQELKDKADQVRPDIEEDRLCVAALRKRDVEVVAMVEHIFQDPLQTDVIPQLDDMLKKEVLRHVEFIKKLHHDVKQDATEAA